jgi:ubiquinone/menaquinone biosynthesis C-methylase UbiE
MFGRFGRRGFRHLQGQIVGEEYIKHLNLKEGMNVADVGSGPGRFSIPIAKIVYPGKVYAIDIDEESLEYINKVKKEQNIDNIITIKADITEKIPLEDKSIDFALMVNALHGLIRLNREENTLNEIKRILKDDGRIGIVEFRKDLLEFGPPEWVRLSEEDTISIFKKFGFRVINGPVYVENEYILIFSK